MFYVKKSIVGKYKHKKMIDWCWFFSLKLITSLHESLDPCKRIFWNITNSLNYFSQWPTWLTILLDIGTNNSYQTHVHHKTGLPLVENNKLEYKSIKLTTVPILRMCLSFHHCIFSSFGFLFFPFQFFFFDNFGLILKPPQNVLMSLGT